MYACADEFYKPMQPARVALRDSVTDNGTTVTLNEDWQIAKCVLENLGAPTHVVDKVGRTRGLDGMQDAEWDGLEASWNYDRDNGLDMTIHDTRG